MLKDELYAFSKTVRRIKLTFEWARHKRLIEYSVFRYDYKARLCEIQRSETHTLTDGFITMERQDMIQKLAIDFSKAEDTTAFLITIDGFENFQNDDEILIECFDNTDYSEFSKLYRLQAQMLSTFQGLFVCVFYIDGFHIDSRSRWIMKAVEDPMYAYSVSEQESFCAQRVVTIVPSFERFRYHLFANVRSVCAALSSQSLPKLKDKFLKYKDGVNREMFTELIFNNLYENHPKIIDPEESTYSVSLIHELFNSIDFSGDDLVSWEEFTTFVIQTIVMIQTDNSNEINMDEYIIEYEEDVTARDRCLSPHVIINLMRYIPETRVILVIPVESEVVYVFTAKNFSFRSKIDPTQLVISGNLMNDQVISNEKKPQKKTNKYIYDVVYLSGKDYYCFSADDYSITICKEVVILGGKRVTYNQVHRFLHTLNHPMLCWSHTSQVLCSISSSNTLFGWDLIQGVPIYQSTRHTEVITNLISINSLEVFATCSMDKTILFQSASTGRVKGILKGHSRGIKCMDANSNYLISGGFDCEGKVWGLDSKEIIVRLQGHKACIVQAKLMCERAHSDQDYRAVTVDENGEFRLWNIQVSERYVEPPIRVAIQIFEMTNPQTPMNRIKYIALGYEALHKSSSFYASIYAIGSKLLKFLPKKSSKDFLSATCVCYNASFGIVMISTGNTISQFEIATGRLSSVQKDFSETDITAMCVDSHQERTYYIGNNSGCVSSINFRAGTIIDTIQVSSYEITCMGILRDAFNSIIVGSSDGMLHVLKENIGILSITNNKAIDVFGSNLGIGKCCIVDAFHVVICSSSKSNWAIWDPNQSTPMLFGNESNTITGIELISTSMKSFCEYENSNGENNVDSAERLIVFALAISNCILVYTVDILSLQCYSNFRLVPDIPIYINQFSVLRKGPSDVNYLIPYTANIIFIAFTDDGQIITWDFNEVIERSEYIFRKKIQSRITTAENRKSSKYKTIRYSFVAVENVEDVYSTSMWRGHSDTVTSMANLSYYGLFLSAGNDGYARIWNLHQECVGEIKLPNITDEMKDYKMNVVSNNLWNLILEVKPLNRDEEITAQLLVKSILARLEINSTTSDNNCLLEDNNDNVDDLLVPIESISMISTTENSLHYKKSNSEILTNREVQLQSLIPHSYQNISTSNSVDSSVLEHHSLDGFSFMTTGSSTSLLTSNTILKANSLADLSFGSQTSYYKNAEKAINSSKKHSIERTKHLLELSRIDRKIKSIKLIKKTASSELNNVSEMLFQKSFAESESITNILQKEEEQSQLRCFKSSLLVPPEAIRKPLERTKYLEKAELLSQQLTKELKRDDTRAQIQLKQKIRRRVQESFEEKAALEKKLQNTILFVLAGPKNNENKPRKKLKTRDLLPSYTIQDVQNFVALINKVDIDYSGSLDIHEWITLFTSTGSAIQAHQAVSMFDGAETKSGGKLYISDLVPMLFPKANKTQKKLIIQYSEAEIYAAKSIATKQINKEPLTVYEMERLFECYDTKCIGFISLRFVRERLNQMQLPVNVLVEVTQDLYSDDYVSIDEFLKVFRIFISDINKKGK